MATLTLVISGSGGAGAISTGEMLLHIAALSGYYGILKKTFSPQIRGGEAAAIIRLGDQPVDTFDEQVDVLIAFDWQNFSRFADEIPVSASTVIIKNGDAGELPAEILRCQTGSDKPGTGIITIDGNGIASDAESSWVNLVFLGLMAKALGCPYPTAENIVLKRLAKHAEPLRDAARRTLMAGYELGIPAQLQQRLKGFASRPANNSLWLASGNQMAALGALEAGIRFVAAYPITPASDLLEFLAQHIEPLGGHLVQAEDELAAINMAIGAGFGGVPAMTATSGPGLALMAEAMGLAVASETPVVIVDVMRCGPSTGIPTKSEQGDFNLAVYGVHGDAPHIVVACNSIADCYTTTAWAAELATRLQTLVIVLSDQFLGQSLQVISEPGKTDFSAAGVLATLQEDQSYQRYLDTETGVSPMATPGLKGAMYTAEGLEHSQNAVPSPKATEHLRQLDKRQRKLLSHDYGDHWADLSGAADNNTLIICWGSTKASVIEAQQLLVAKGRDIACLCLRQLCPLPTEKLAVLFAKASRLVVVEQNHSGQFFHYLRSMLPQFTYQSLVQPGPKAITPSQILAIVENPHD